ncbi:MAG: hypothetical protein M1820_004320 [Bogoriella megaspora]|nr:MAG: hypothetical protein M1820_004320 [Bogoriella megaspora]
MATAGLSKEWLNSSRCRDPNGPQFEGHVSVPPFPVTVEEYIKIRAERVAQSQESLKQDPSTPLAILVKVENLKISLPEVVKHDFEIRVYRPTSAWGTKLPVMLYLFTVGTGCRAIIARGCEIIIVSFAYRSSIEVPWQTVLSDAEYAMKWSAASAADFGGDTSLGFLIGGAESGAHLAATCAIRAKTKYPNIRLTGQVLIVPTLIAWPDPQIPKKWEQILSSHKEHANASILNKALYEALLAKLNVPSASKRDGENFPMWASLKDLPPAYLAMDECDPTRD